MVLKLAVAPGAVEVVLAVLVLEELWQAGVLKAITGLLPAALPMLALEVLKMPGKAMVPGRDRKVFVLPVLPRWRRPQWRSRSYWYRS